MTYLHDGDERAITTFEFYPCRSDKIYISGLRNGDYIQSEKPYYFQNQNGRVVGIDTRFNEFKVFDTNQTLINKLFINWKVDCVQEVSKEKTDIQISNNHQTDFFGSLLGIVFLIYLIFAVLRVITKRKRTHQNENQP